MFSAGIYHGERTFYIGVYQAIAWVDYLFFNVPSLHTWMIYQKKDDMEFSFFDGRFFFDRIITTTM